MAVDRCVKRAVFLEKLAMEIFQDHSRSSTMSLLYRSLISYAFRSSYIPIVYRFRENWEAADVSACPGLSATRLLVLI